MRKSLYSKSIFFCAGFFICLTFIVHSRCHGYVMPAEQLLDFMAGNFSKFNSLVIIQSTLQTYQENERVFKEEIRLKSPDLFNLKALDNIAGKRETPDMTYRQLLMANSGENLEHLLSVMGINLQSVAFTRIDGVIAYRIGEKEPGSPKLIIEKERFIPLLMEYILPEDLGGETITVRFLDYREEDDKYYPYEISYSAGDTISETYTIQTFQYNVPIDESFFQRFAINPSQYISPSEEAASVFEEERLRNILKTFEEKYQ